jgi:Zn-dependent protease with chaperone function
MPSPAAAAETLAARHPRSVLGTVAGLVGLIAVLVGLVVAVVFVWWAGLAAVVVVAGLLWVGLVAPRVSRAEERALVLVGPARPADARADARLLNVVEGLAPGGGVNRPRVLVVDDPAPNALALGRDARRGCIVTTTGLLGRLSRMQLEAVVAHLLVQLRDGSTTAPTLLLSFRPGRPPVARAVAAAADAAAVTLTRYPPGLSSALQVVAAAGPSAPAGASPVLAPLWLAPPGDVAGVQARIEALDEL